MISTYSKLHDFSSSKKNENNKNLIKKYVKIKNNKVYAVVYRSSHTIYYNLDFKGDTHLFLFHD